MSCQVKKGNDNDGVIGSDSLVNLYLLSAYLGFHIKQFFVIVAESWTRIRLETALMLW